MPAPNYATGSALAAATLEHLAAMRQDPARIDEHFSEGLLSPRQLVMTSMLLRGAAVITPFHPGLVYDSSLFERVSASRNHGRPFTEAVLRYSARRNAASLVLRGLYEGEEDYLLETAWEYTLPTHDTPSNSTEEVINRVNEVSQEGRPVEARTGLVDIRHMQPSQHWGIAAYENPTMHTWSIFHLVKEFVDYVEL